ncbi:MAG: hypothetical protein ACLT8T_02055, partial [Oscillospiraceae bacterium]
MLSVPAHRHRTEMRWTEMKPARRFLVKAAKLFDLPADIAANLPHIELRGFEECSLDCHRAIIAYEPEKIIVAVNTG